MNVVIGNGLIGRALYYHLRRFGEVQITDRSQVDLSSNHWQLPRGETTYICAGKTSTKECEEHPEETYLVNVTNTVKLVEMLKPARVIWISSERVFDGSIPYRKVSDPVCPTTEYGRQKAEAEKLLLDLGVTAVRFSKVLGWDVPLFEGWIKSLEKDVPIHPYSNMSMSPISVNFAVDVLQKIEDGLLQVSADRDITYAQIAYHIANYMGKIELVQPVEGESHPYTTLVSNIPGIDVPNAWTVIEDWCRNRLLARTQ